MCVCLCIPPFIARQRIGKHVPAATNTQATLEELLEKYVCGPVCVSPYHCYVTLRYRRTHDNEEFLKASFSLLSLCYQTKVGNYFFLELLLCCICVCLGTLFNCVCCLINVLLFIKYIICTFVYNGRHAFSFEFLVITQ
jgi:hypothetical protein